MMEWCCRYIISDKEDLPEGEIINGGTVETTGDNFLCLGDQKLQIRH